MLDFRVVLWSSPRTASGVVCSAACASRASFLEAARELLEELASDISKVIVHKYGNFVTVKIMENFVNFPGMEEALLRCTRRCRLVFLSFERLGGIRERLGEIKEMLGERREMLGERREMLGERRERLGGMKERCGRLKKSQHMSLW